MRFAALLEALWDSALGCGAGALLLLLLLFAAGKLWAGGSEAGGGAAWEEGCAGGGGGSSLGVFWLTSDRKTSLAGAGSGRVNHDGAAWNTALAATSGGTLST